MMHVELRYFSGTGNSYKILDTCKEVFLRNGCNVTLASVTNESDIHAKADLIGFCFPVYAFAIPRICRQYLLNLPEFKSPINTFVLITAGDPEESGFSVQESSKILNNKGLKVTYSKVVHMPANWTVCLNPPSKEEAQAIIKAGVLKTRAIAQEILKGELHQHAFNYPPAYSKWGFYKDYYLFKWLGVSNLWRDYRTDETCDGCGLCAKICPTDSIQIAGDKPKWLKTCEHACAA